MYKRLYSINTFEFDLSFFIYLFTRLKSSTRLSIPELCTETVIGFNTNYGHSISLIQL